MIYLMKDEKRNACLFKVGFTADLDRRLLHYATHNPTIELVSVVVTYSKTKHRLETEIKDEITKMGYEFIISELNKVKTEWFAVPYDSELYKRLTAEGLKVFKACKRRKVLMGE